MQNPKILYWKWDDSHVDTGKYRQGIDNIVSQSCFTMIFICTHWCKQGLNSPKTHDALQEACAILHGKGKKMILELDARSEKTTFCKQYPDRRTGIVYWKEVSLNAADNTVSFPIQKGSGTDLFAGDRQSGEELLCTYTYRRTADGYLPASLEDVTEDCKLTRNSEEEVCVALPSNGPPMATAFVAVVSWYDSVDLCSDEYDEFNTFLFQKYQDIPLDGAAVDELSLMMNPLFRFSPATYQTWIEHPYVSYRMIAQYGERYGRSYTLDLLNRFVGNDGIPENRIRSINDYHKFIRNIVTTAEEKFYRNVKRYFGEDAFVGVHPTWYAIEEIDNTPEIWKNGVDWWAVPREYGFTDEIMLYPVRLALTHKANATVFYNMWYGEGTGILQNFFREIYKNARYGGRTISLSYECKNETLVQQLCTPGELEAVSACEERIAFLDLVQKSPAASDVLIIMGIPASCSELYNADCQGKWNVYDSIFKRVFSLARGIWDAGYNCDLVGSYEIDTNALYLDSEGYACYGNQRYSYVIYAYPQYATPGELQLLEDMARSPRRHMIIGDMDRDFSANDCKARFNAIRKNTVFFYENPEISDILAHLIKNDIKKNRVSCGCVLQDGAIILTHPAPETPAGNGFTSEFDWHGKPVYLAAEDAAYVKLSRDGRVLRLEAPALKELRVDGKSVLCNPSPIPVCKTSLTFAFLGDSITNAMFESHERKEDEFKGLDLDAVYHYQLKQRLANRFQDSFIYIVNAGVSGNGMADGLRRLQSDVLEYAPDITVVCFGLNDVHGGEENLKAYQDTLKEIFNRLKQAGSKVVFMTPNRMCSTITEDDLPGSTLATAQALCCNAQKSGLMDRYIDAAKKVCAREQIPLCDCYAVWTEWYRKGKDINGLLANHINQPNRAVHKVFAEKLFDTISKAYRW